MNDQVDMREKARQYTGNGDVLCLTALAQPLVSEMQAVIRFQHQQLQECARAIEHALARIGSIDQVQHHLGVCTETYERLTAALADVRDLPVDQVREDVIPGSAAFHRPREAA